MKRYCIALLVFVGMTYCKAEEHSAEESFLKAHQLYQHKDYAKAVYAYESIPSKSSETLYNIGNCYYHMQQYPYALLYWERASKHASVQLLHNIIYNVHVLESDLQKPHASSFDYYMQWARAFFSLLFLQLMVLALLLLFIILIMLRPGWYVVMSGVCSITLMALILVIHIHYYSSVDRAIVIKDDVGVYAGPGETYAQIGALQAADKVTIGKREDTWYKICHGTVTGWVSSISLEIV